MKAFIAGALAVVAIAYAAALTLDSLEQTSASTYSSANVRR